MDLLESFLIGIASGLVTSIITTAATFCFVEYFRPKIKISKEICYDKYNPNNIRIKIVNLTMARLNIRYSLQCVRHNMDGTFNVIEVLPTRTPCSFIDRYKIGNKMGINPYAISLSFCFDENAYPLDGNDHLQFVLFAENYNSNKCKYFQRIYFKTDFKQGKFATGKSTDVIT